MFRSCTVYAKPKKPNKISTALSSINDLGLQTLSEKETGGRGLSWSKSGVRLSKS